MTYRTPPATIIRMAELRLAGRSYEAIGAALRREGLSLGRDDKGAGAIVKLRVDRIVPRKRPRYRSYPQAECKDIDRELHV